MSQTFVNDDCKAILDFYYQFNKSDLSGTEHEKNISNVWQRRKNIWYVICMNYTGISFLVNDPCLMVDSTMREFHK
jgi:hypothetical protein